MKVPIGLTLVVLLLAASGISGQTREFARVRPLGRALVEYRDGTTHAVAAYYHSQLHHDSRWLLIEFGIASPRALRLGRDQLELVTPSGRIVPLAAQRRWGADANRARTLLQQAGTTRHSVRTYFNEINGVEKLRFFTRPEDGDTVIDALQVAPDQLAFGDLLFEAPTGAWERGGYALNVRHNLGTASLPIDLK